MAVPQSFLDLLQQQRRRTKLTGVPQDPYGYAEAAAAGAPSRLETARTQKLAAAEVGTQAEQFGQSLAQQKLHFTESLAEQKRAAFASERETGISTEAQIKAAKQAEIMGYVGMGAQAPLTYYAGKELGLWGAEAVVAEGVGMGTGTTVAEGTILAEGAVAEGGITAGGVAQTAALIYGGAKLAEATGGVKEIPKEIAEVGGFVADIFEKPIEAALSFFGGCIIITAVTDPYSYEVNVTRKYRDKFLSQQTLRGYYMVAEKIVPLMHKSERFKKFIKKHLVDHIVRHSEWGIGLRKKKPIISSFITTTFLSFCDIVGSTVPSFVRLNGEVW